MAGGCDIKKGLHPLLWFPIQFALTVPAIALEQMLIHAFMGWKPANYALHGGGMVGQICISNIFLTFVNYSPYWTSIMRKYPTPYVALFFFIANFVLAWPMYFGELYLLVFMTNRSVEQASFGVTLHQQLVFFVLCFGAGWFYNFPLLDASALATAILWYLITWMFWLPFGVAVMDNTSFTDLTKSNTYLIVGGCITALIFSNLTNLNMMQYGNYKTYKNKLDQFAFVGAIKFFQGFIVYVVMFWTTRLLMGTTEIHLFCSSVQGNIALLWVAQIVVGETISAWLFELMCGKKTKMSVNYIFYVIISQIISYGVFFPLHFLQHKVLWKYLLHNVMRLSDFGSVFSRLDYQFGYGAGTTYFGYNAIKNFCRARQEQKQEKEEQEKNASKEEQKKD